MEREQTNYSTDTSSKFKEVKKKPKEKKTRNETKISQSKNVQIEAFTKILFYIDENSSKKTVLSLDEERKIKSLYRNLIEKAIKIGEIDTSVIIYSLILAKRASKSVRSICKFDKGQFYSIYSACLFLSLKLLVDYELWKLTDFCCICDLGEEELKKLEMNLFIYILEMKVFVSEGCYCDQVKKIDFLVRKILEEG